MNTSVLAMVLKLLLVWGTPLVLAALILRRIGRWFDLSHPWWTHLPAAWVYAGTVGLATCVLALGGDAPVAYINSVNQYPTFGEFLSYFAPLGILWLGLSMLIDELWARQEIRKSFNWMSLLDEAVLGFMLILAYGKDYQFHPGPHGTLPATVALNYPIARVVAAMLAAAVLLELFRRPAPREPYVAAEGTGLLEAELAKRAASGERIAYFEGQNPAYVTILVVVVCASLVFGAAVSWRSTPWVAFLLLLAAGAVTLVCGGLRVSVTSTLLEVRLGMLGIRLLTLPTAEISEAAIHDFAPLKDFGGYGLRANREMMAFFFAGNRGVKITTVQGKRYLVGSDHPERLAAVLRAVTGQR